MLLSRIFNIINNMLSDDCLTLRLAAPIHDFCASCALRRALCSERNSCASRAHIITSASHIYHRPRETESQATAIPMHHHLAGLIGMNFCVTGVQRSEPRKTKRNYCSIFVSSNKRTGILSLVCVGKCRGIRQPEKIACVHRKGTGRQRIESDSHRLFVVIGFFPLTFLCVDEKPQPR